MSAGDIPRVALLGNELPVISATVPSVGLGQCTQPPRHLRVLAHPTLDCCSHLCPRQLPTEGLGTHGSALMHAFKKTGQVGILSSLFFNTNLSCSCSFSVRFLVKMLPRSREVYQTIHWALEGPWASASTQGRHQKEVTVSLELQKPTVTPL